MILAGEVVYILYYCEYCYVNGNRGVKVSRNNDCAERKSRGVLASFEGVSCYWHGIKVQDKILSDLSA